jgi:signal transduction histidine kinase
MERVSQGDFSFKLLTSGNDEITDMAKYFNNMAEEIRRAREVMENLNLWLEEKVRERTEELRILFNVSKTIGSSMDMELLISRAIELLQPVIKSELYLLLVADEKGLFRPRVGSAGVVSKIKPVAIGEEKGILGEAVRENKIVYCNDAVSDPRCQHEIFNSFGAKTLMATPLRSKGRAVGILIIGTVAEYKYSEEKEGALLSTIADQLAVAIENIFALEREREAVARLTELDRLKSEFISMISHELRTPVTSADGYVSLFLAGVAGPLNDDQRKYLTIVRENNQRLLSIINRLLDFSRIETGRFKIQRELVSINEVIDAAQEDMKDQIEKKQAVIKRHLNAKNINFMGDRQKMREVFINLIENALKFRRVDQNPVVSIYTKDKEDFMEISVEDNGVGIEKEYLGRIFNKFFQVEETLTRNVGGLGLGLSVVKEIIGDHHGKIWAESEGKGKGASFIFQLPLAEKA